MDIATSTQREKEQRVAEEYLSSLSDLNCNSKPLINMLTMLAEENIEYAAVIVKVVEQHIAKVPPEIKLPILYLIDSIVKNVKSTYVQLFGQCIVSIFCGAFEKVNEKIRERMYALRQTWNEVFSAQKLYALDVKVKCLDHNWPITAKQPSIHVNPNFLKVNSAQAIPTEMEKILQDKTRELLELKKRKLELELEATKKHLEEQEKQFSKTAEGVIPPVETLVGNNLQTVGIRTPSIGPQMMPGLIPSNFIGGPTSIAINPAMRPAMFPAHMRGFRPNLHSNMVNIPPQGMSTGISAANVNKPKVHPVNSALLNSVRQRDPRLQRQQQQQQQNHKSKQQNVRSIQPEKDKHDHNHSHKPPTLISSNSRSSANIRSSKNSQRDKERDRERDRKRSESKSSSTSSIGSTSANSERKKRFEKTSDIQSSKCDKDAFEIDSLSTAFKRKSNSPSLSPSKSRDSKRSNSYKSRHSSRSKTKSRSRSPENRKSTTRTSYGDIDLRCTSTSSTSPLMINSPDKRAKLSNSDQEPSSININEELTTKSLTSPNINDKHLDKTMPVADLVSGLMDIDLRSQFVVASNSGASAPISISTHDHVFDCSLSFSSDKQNLELNNKFIPTNVNKRQTSATTNSNLFIYLDEVTLKTTTTTTSAKNVATTSSPKVSFKIQKNFNKLEKSAENILASVVTAATTTGDSIANNSQSNAEIFLKDSESAIKAVNAEVSKDIDEDGKKRPLGPITDEEEPLAKKSKSTKIDALFGSEDVDLRQLIPPILAPPTSSQDDIAPPPPSINMPADIGGETSEKLDNLKNDCNKNCAPEPKSSLEDVRAKLAKTAKLSKLSKLDKLTRDIDHRNKLAELQINEDTQEANDEKIRTMITQAQELLESNSINQDQYKHLVKTVMSINETNKLKEAKRRESLNAIKQKLNNDEGSNDSSERNLAMQAILKKRIPKLNKQMAIEQAANTDTQQAEGHADNVEDSPRTEDKQDCNDEPSAPPQSAPTRTNRGQREKRGRKDSKWGERVVDLAVNIPGVAQRPWNSLMGPNKRGIPVFRGIGPQNIRPPWPISGGNGNMNGLPHVQPHFGKSHMGVIRANTLAHIAPSQTSVIPKPRNSIDNPQEDLVRTTTIDGAAKEIRFYDQVAIVFMEKGPREISFENGQRSICIDNNEPVVLHFNDGYKALQIDGETFNVRFGFPSRELYINDHWYEIYFGGPSISVPIHNNMHTLKAEGPPPKVKYGPLRRDLVVGKINMIVDAHNVIPLFLDARIQTFKLADSEHTIQFADNLLTVILDGTPTRVEYGGLPKSLFLGGKKYFVRFGALPQGVVAGTVHIKDMIYVETKPPLEGELSREAVEQLPVSSATAIEIIPVALQKSIAPSSVPILPAAALSNINIDELFQKLVSTGILGGTSGILPAVNTATNVATSQADKILSESNQPGGLLASESNSIEEVPPPPPSVHMDPIKPIDLSKAESIKTRQAAIIETLFSGMQCSSCGVRFPPEQTIKYSQHLDWHFRHNRRERDSSRKAHARKWYYDLNDWMQYEEIEDLEEREKNFFENQQNDLDTVDESSNQRSTNSPIPTCPAGANDVNRACDMCQENFEQFYDNELEEWHLRAAIGIENKFYHPLCYEDFKASLNNTSKLNQEEEELPEINDISLIQIDDDNAVDIVIKVEDDDKDEGKTTSGSNTPDDEDDDVIVLPNEEPSVTEIVDDDDEDEYVPANVTREQMGTIIEEDGRGEHNETAESDVEIEEPNIPFTDLDTYVEKEFLEKNSASEVSFMKVKIKEEPKEDDDEDDGFEEVGTVVQVPEEISLHSSEDTQTQTIDSSNTALSPIAERPPSTISSLNHNEDVELVMDPPGTDLNISMDGNIDTGDEHNLSAAGPVPTVPLASLVNKIKINITKNTVTTNSNTGSSSTNAASLTMSNHTDSLGHTSSSVLNLIPTISTIPVLCGGGTTISSIASCIVGCGAGMDYDEHSKLRENSVSTISVIGSYGSTVPTITHINRPIAIVPIQPPKSTTPPPVEETITYELKSALRKTILKKKEKVVCGNETSGLCSIM